MVVQAHGQPLLMTLLFPLILGLCGFPLILLGLHIFDKHCCYINQGYCFSLCHGQHYLLCPCYFWRFLPPSNSGGEFAASWKGSDPLPHGRDLTPSHMGGPASCIRCYTLLIVCSPTILPVLNITFIIVGVVSSPGVFCHAGLVSHYLVTAM